MIRIYRPSDEFDASAALLYMELDERRRGGWAVAEAHKLGRGGINGGGDRTIADDDHRRVTGTGPANQEAIGGGEMDISPRKQGA